MIVDYSPQQLIDFELKIIELFNNKQILAPIHLDNGNEVQLIKIFTDYINPEDWVMGTWRTHYKCLLKGVPQQLLIDEIVKGHSISLCFSDYNIVSSAIVGGILPIALGTSLAIKRNKQSNKVVCFLGDMGSETGTFHECLKYSVNYDLPILWVIESNNKSVCTVTKDCWALKEFTYKNKELKKNEVIWYNEKVLYFEYSSDYPHAGGGARIQF